MSTFKHRALADANWVRSFGAGTEWQDGEASGFRPNRLAELKAAGVLLPHPSKPGLLIVGIATVIRRAFKVLSGERYTKVEGFPVVLAARYVRMRAHAASYGNHDYCPKGWHMKVVPTKASRERYRQAQIADHCETGWCDRCGNTPVSYRDPDGTWVECACSAGYVD